MKSISSIVLSFSISALAAAPAALAQHAGDVGLAVIDNRIVTGFYELGVFTPGQRVFGSELGELFPDFTDEPGFVSLPGVFPVPSAIRFNVLAAVRLWDGSGFGSVIPPEQISIGFGPLSPVLTPLTDGLTPGFSLAVASNGEWHRHLEYILLSPASGGIYLLQMNLAGNTATTQASLPFWFVFNQNQSELEHDAAIEWTNTNMVLPPAPACLADVASDSLDTARTPNNSVGPEDLDAFIAGFIAGDASIADVASDSLDTAYNPNGSVGPEDLDAFIAAFIAGC